MTNGDVTCGFMPAAANARADAPSARRDVGLLTTSAMKSGSFTPAIRASLASGGGLAARLRRHVSDPAKRQPVTGMAGRLDP